MAETNPPIQEQLADLWSADREAQNRAFLSILEITDQPVDWAYAAWSQVLENLEHPDNHNRAIAAQVLSNLAKSDPEGRILQDFDALLKVTHDERFVTARHSLQAIWKVGTAGEKQRERVVESLARRFRECQGEKNCTLVRFDILVGLRKLYDATGHAGIRERALGLIEMEADLKYRKKYARVWR